MGKRDCLDLLKRRIERLVEELEVDAPNIIIDTEVKLIQDACEKYLAAKDITTMNLNYPNNKDYSFVGAGYTATSASYVDSNYSTSTEDGLNYTVTVEDK